MFHYSEISSTGEPPTPPPQLVIDLGSAPETSNNVLSTGIASHDAGMGLRPARESDSGYEASPCSIGTNSCTSLFFGEGHTDEVYSTPPEFPSSADDEVLFQDCNSVCVLMDSEIDNPDSDLCPHCSSAFSCNCATARSSPIIQISAATAIASDHSNCDNSSYSSNTSSSRPSSFPIEIPIHSPPRQPAPSPSRMTRMDSYFATSIHSNLAPSSRSNPIERNLATIMETRSVSFPRPTVSPFRTQPGPIPSPSFLQTIRREIIGQFERRFRVRRPVRSRRHLIDSDASSISSSDGEGPEDVFDIPMDDEGPPVFDMSDSNCSLPDVVLQASPTAGRRRSASINIPPQEVIRSIGSSLRRLSEEFELTLMQRARRRTSENSLQLNGNS